MAEAGRKVAAPRPPGGENLELVLLCHIKLLEIKSQMPIGIKQELAIKGTMDKAAVIVFRRVVELCLKQQAFVFSVTES